MAEEYDYLFKILLVGAPHVGKSSLMTALSTDEFQNSSCIPTIGVDLIHQTIQLDGQKVKLQVWDTAGCERFGPIIKHYFHGVDGVIIVYDVTDKYSFDQISLYIDRHERWALKDSKVILVANKCDLIQERMVSFETGKSMAEANDLLYFEVSCKFPKQIEFVIVSLVSSILVNKDKQTELIPTEQRVFSKTASNNGFFTGCCLS